MIKKFKNKNILIFGSGSIGNHMTKASRELGFNVYVTDKSAEALERMKYNIYPKRYKKWDININLVDYKDVFKFKKKFDLIIIGTPPTTHLAIYYLCKKKLKYGKILIEKPLTNYSDKLLRKFSKEKNNQNIFCGYNHSVSKSFIYFFKKLNKYKKINQIDVSWKENWDGILKAHFWLKNEFSSYLGDIKNGGGALQEHSHGLHLLSLILKNKNISLVNCDFIKKGIFKKNKYDLFYSISGIKNKIFFNYQTDLLTKPADKSIKISDGENQIYLIFNYAQNKDAVIIHKNGIQISKKIFKKSRTSEFKNEIKYILNYKNDLKNNSNLSINNSIDVINIIKRAFNEKK